MPWSMARRPRGQCRTRRARTGASPAPAANGDAAVRIGRCGGEATRVKGWKWWYVPERRRRRDRGQPARERSG
jgi:hypothetical protein